MPLFEPPERNVFELRARQRQQQRLVAQQPAPVKFLPRWLLMVPRWERR